MGDVHLLYTVYDGVTVSMTKHKLDDLSPIFDLNSKENLNHSERTSAVHKGNALTVR